MTVALELRFPGCRYHATPWDAHVNEGRVEWPPSPWRLLRALVAVRFLKARDEVPEPVLRALLAALAAEPPRYALPRQVSGAHTRHYMPLYADATTKVFDTFLHVPDDVPVHVVWPAVELSSDLFRALAVLASRLTYLGRAESWVEAYARDAAPDILLDCRPVDAGSPADDGDEVVRVLAPVPPGNFAHWRAAVADEQLTRTLEAKRRKAAGRGKDPNGVKLTKKDRERVEAGLPEDLLAVLSADTTLLRKTGWNRPPGTRFVEYARPRAARAVTATSPATAAQFPTVARLAVAGSVRPSITEAVHEADKIRTALLSWSDSSPVFSGRDPAHVRITGHRHAFVLPEANGRDGRITHVTLFAPMGFDDVARRALEGVRKVWQRRSPDLQLVLTGLGDPSTFGGLDRRTGQSPILARSRVWVSRTPFVPTRHPKRSAGGVPKLDGHGRAVGSPEHDLVRLLCELLAQPPWSQRLDPSDIRVEPVGHTTLGGKPVRWLAFETRRRRGGGTRGPLGVHGFRVHLPVEIQGPLALGYGAHFGLGVFEPEPSS